MISTDHLQYDEETGHVELVCLNDTVRLGPIDDCDDECPLLLLEELEQLRDQVRDAREFARACEATASDADLRRHDSRGW